MKTSKLARMQLDKQLSGVRFMTNLTCPVYGWIKIIRNALGMTSRQFAKRMGVTQARASAVENGEIEDSLTLKTLKEAAKALNCQLVYFLIPEKSLEETVKEQSIKFVKSDTRSIVHSMGLENQSVDAENTDDFIAIRAEEILLKNSSNIWDVE
jgi:predicted DNA-binding mobile mystery protein A